MKRKASSSKNLKGEENIKRYFKDTKENKINFEDFIKNIEESRKKYFLTNCKNTFNAKRIKVINGSEQTLMNNKNVMYWMSRDQRVQDNWALFYAQKLALRLKSDLHVCFFLVPKFLDATIRHYEFMIRGLEEVEKECRELKINFHLLLGPAKDHILDFVCSHNIGTVINDFSPLRLPRQWIDDVSKILPSNIYLCQVDAHNVVPVWEASPKMEVAARTIRSKISRQLGEFLSDFPPIIMHPNKETLCQPVNWKAARESLEVDVSVKEVATFDPGTVAGLKNLWEFTFSDRLNLFNVHRNNPTKSCLSNISPWLHFGQISSQRCILVVQTRKSLAREGVDIFVEEALVRRELADNFCYYNENYDNISGAPNWSRHTLNVHKSDERPYKYTLDQLDTGKTHDKLWNAAQLQMVREGKMHGFLRMYWAKKILEWTGEGPEEALKRAIWLNDRYSIDGRDPNGYTGIMWSICGVHDQGWKERDIFGKVRFMNYKGCERKFDVKLFESMYK